MIRRRLLLAFALSLAAALSACARQGSAQQVTLRWKYEEGTELAYRVSSHNETELPMDQGISVFEQAQTMRWSVLEVAPNGDATLRITTERVQMNMESPMLNLAYDSETDEVPDNPQAKIFSAMVGKSYTIVIGPEGTVKSLEGMDQVREAVLEAMGPDMAGMADAMIGQMLNDETMTSVMQQGIQTFPERAMGPGDTWDTSFSFPFPMLGTMSASLDFTLERIEERDGGTVAVISNSGEIQIGNAGDSQLAGMMEFGNSAVIGTMEFDVDRGLLLNSTSTTTMEVTVAAGGQEMVIGIITTLTMELVEG